MSARSLFSPLFFLPFLGLASIAAAGDKLLVIGDSLSKEYEVTFPGLDSSCVPLPVEKAGIDPTDPDARNWAEILHNKRRSRFDLGIYKDALDCPPDGWDDLRLSGHEYNWAVAGATSRFLRNFVRTTDYDEWEDDSDISNYLNIAEFFTQTDWREAAAEWRDDMANLLGNTADAVVIMCGGNDLKSGNSDPLATDTGDGGRQITYGTIYSGNGTGRGDPTNLIDSIRKNILSIVTYVRDTAGPDVPIVLCSAPHVGATPNVKADGFTDPVRTARCTAAIEQLNAGLATIAANNNCGFADLYKITKDLLDGKPFYIGGVKFHNEADPLYDNQGDELPLTTRRRYLFTPLAAPASDGFHPTPAPQAVIANTIIQAFKTKYPAKFSTLQPLSSGEILWDVLGIETDTGFEEAMAASGVSSSKRGPFDDPDRDGLANIIEYALESFDVAQSDIHKLPPVLLNRSVSPNRLTMTWKPRFADNAYAKIICEESTNLVSWTPVASQNITTQTDGSQTASVPVPNGSTIYLRLKVEIIP